MVEEYVVKHEIRAILQEQMQDLLAAKPANVFQFLADWAAERGAKRSPSSLPTGASASSYAAVTNASIATNCPTGHGSSGTRRNSNISPSISAGRRVSMSNNNSISSQGSAGSFGNPLQLHQNMGPELAPLSPFNNRGPAPLFERNHELTPPLLPQSLANAQPLDLEGSVTVGEGDIRLDLENDEDNSPRLGTDFANLGESMMTPRSRGRSVISSETASNNGMEKGEEGQTWVQCDAAAPLPLRMPDGHRTHVHLNEHYSKFKRTSNDRVLAVRNFDNLKVSLKLFDMSDYSKVEIDEMLREVYCIVNVSLRHPDLVNVYDGFLETSGDSGEPVLYVVQERLEAPLTLKAFTEQHGLLKEEQARNVLSQLVHTLHFIHFHGQPHHRVHAENIYVTGIDQSGLKIKLGLFGLSPNTARSEEDFGEDIRCCGEVLAQVTEPTSLTTGFGEIVDSMTDDLSNRPPTSAILGFLEAKSPIDIIEETSIPFVSTDTKGVILTWNKPAQELFGYSKEEIVGQNITILMRGNVQDNHVQYMETYQKTRKKWTVDESITVTCFAKDGKQLTLEMRTTERSATEFVAIFRDVSSTLSIQMMNRLKVFGSKIVDYVPVAVVTIDALDFNILDFNRSAAEMFGYPPAQMVGQHMTALAPSEKHYSNMMVDLDFDGPRNVVYRENSGAISTARMLSFEEEIIVTPPAATENGENGEKKVSPSNSTTTRPDVRTVVHNYFVPENSITNDFNSLFTTIADTLLTGIIIIDEHGLIKKMSRFAEEVFEWTETEVLNENVRVLMDRKIGERHQQYVERFKKYGISDVLGRPNQMQGVTKSGKKIKIRLVVQPYYRHSRIWFVGFITPLGDVLSVQEAVGKATTPTLGPNAKIFTGFSKLDASGSSSCTDVSITQEEAPDAANETNPGTRRTSSTRDVKGLPVCDSRRFSTASCSSSTTPSSTATSPSTSSLEPANKISPTIHRRRGSNLGSFIPTTVDSGATKSTSTSSGGGGGGGGSGGNVKFELDPKAQH